MPAIPAIIMAGGGIASAAIAKKKGKTQKQMEQLQLDLTNRAAQRQQQLQPVHDSILQAYAAMTSPQGSNVGATTAAALPGAVPNYYESPGGGNWWGQNPQGPQPMDEVPRPYGR
jgi:hypothetical protein